MYWTLPALKNKTVVANFTQWLASELALKYEDGIRVNAIAPGFFIGDQNRAVLINPDGSLTNRSKKHFNFILKSCFQEAVFFIENKYLCSNFNLTYTLFQ